MLGSQSDKGSQGGEKNRCRPAGRGGLRKRNQALDRLLYNNILYVHYYPTLISHTRQSMPGTNPACSQVGIACTAFKSAMQSCVK